MSAEFKRSNRTRTWASSRQNGESQPTKEFTAFVKLSNIKNVSTRRVQIKKSAAMRGRFLPFRAVGIRLV
jgi:hypothetical protein